ncbi:Uncharacterised protein [Chlamydia trachomatis]|nr:Uncharacterised protein [Chlamydia trachomatis]
MVIDSTTIRPSEVEQKELREKVSNSKTASCRIVFLRIPSIITSFI